MDIRKVGVLGVLAALLLAFGAFGLNRADKAAATVNSVTVAPAQINIGASGALDANWLDDAGITLDGMLVSIAPATGSTGSVIVSGCVVIANLDTPVATAATSCSSTGDLDTAAETTIVTGTVTCVTPGAMVATLTHGGTTTTFNFSCGQTLTATVTVEASASTGAAISVLETFPVGLNVSNADITIRVRDQAGNDLNGVEVLAIANTGIIETLGGIAVNANGTCALTSGNTDTDLLREEVNTGHTGTAGRAFFTYCANVGSTLGPTTITFIAINNAAALPDAFSTVSFTIVGPPRSITLTASPTNLICGEKSTITGTVRDAIGQNVSDGTAVNLYTNFGGVAVPGTFASGVHGVSATVGGSFTGFLLTSSPQHVGIYEVVAGIDTNGDGADDLFTQVTVTCSLGAATTAPTTSITSPNTGTAGIRPPNTGDAGLAANGSSTALFSVAGLVAFAIAGLATVKFARR